MTPTYILRVAAVLLVLMTCVELYACEVLAPERCESFGVPQEQNSQSVDDECLCCCTHIVIAERMRLDVTSYLVSGVEPAESPKVEHRPAYLYRPPKV